MKKVISLATLVVMALGFVSPAFAATTTNPVINTSAQVLGGLTLSVVLHKNSSTGPVITSMDFGTLQPLTQTNGGVTLRSSTLGSTGTGNVTAMISANSQSLPYVIYSSGTAMGSLNSGALTVVPAYAALDNGGAGMPAGAQLGTPGTWVTSNKVLYDSEGGAAAIRTIQAIYSITDDPIAGATGAIPVNQAAGTYTGTVTITVTA